ncbi:MAG: hypothetical protein U0792_01120 [Gemmataceae bacterium]
MTVLDKKDKPVSVTRTKVTGVKGTPLEIVLEDGKRFELGMTIAPEKDGFWVDSTITDKTGPLPVKGSQGWGAPAPGMNGTGTFGSLRIQTVVRPYDAPIHEPEMPRPPAGPAKPTPTEK